MDYPPGNSDPTLPQASSFDPSSIFILFIVFAGLIVVIGIGAAIAHQAKISDLRQHGKWVMATVSHVERRSRRRTSQMNDAFPTTIHHYYVVIAHWTDPETGERYIFTSDEKPGSPRYVSGDDVPVLVDRVNYHQYHVEI